MNPALRSYVLERKEAATSSESQSPAQATNSSICRRYRLRDRLTDQQMSALVESFKAGTPAHVLASTTASVRQLSKPCCDSVGHDDEHHRPEPRAVNAVVAVAVQAHCDKTK